jgi:hypothetical protein
LKNELLNAWVFSQSRAPRMRSMTHRGLMCSGLPSGVFGAELTKPISSQEAAFRDKEAVKQG